MKRFIAIILALACVLSLAACDLDPAATTPEINNGSINNGSGANPGQGVVPGGDDMLNSDGTLKIPEPTGGVSLAPVDESTWQSTLSEEAIRAAMKENSITTITSAASSEQYQMFYCAGGRYGSIQKGNIYSESICGVQDGTVYVFNRPSAEDTWTRTTHSSSYDEYVSNHYISGAMQFLSGVASAFGQAQYVEAEKAYVIEQYKITPAPDVEIIGKLKIQLAGEKLYSITLHLDVEGESGALSTVFGTVSSFDLPTDYTEGNSGISTSDPTHKEDHAEPPEATCNEQNWKRLFGNRLIDNLIDERVSIKISNGQQEYAYQMDHGFSRLVISESGKYEEILINRHEYFQRDSKDGQWLHYMNIRDYETILNEKTAVLSQLLNPLADLYKQTSFDDATKCFSLKNISINHGTFGSVTADYDIVIQGGILDQIDATIQSANGTWVLSLSRNKGEIIEPPTDYIEADNGRPGKK